MADKLTVKLRLIVLHPPSEDGAIFGLQDQSGALRAGSAVTEGLAFDCTLNAVEMDDGSANFTGDFAHGTLKDRFMYASTADPAHPGEWVRRIKVPLRGITWAQVEAAVRDDQRLTGRVDGRRSALVSMLGKGWEIA
ncbi:MAG: DUF5990 family protein [Chloroflexota bacterium]|nr:DUF5990 family protein [Chloroflexota bacterium]